MSDPDKTDFPITLAGREYTLCFPITAIWRLEDETGRKFLDDARPKEEIVAEYEHMSRRDQMRQLVAMLWAGLVTHHPEMTMEKAGSFVFLKNMLHIQQVVAEAFSASLSDGLTLEQQQQDGEDPLALRPN